MAPRRNAAGRNTDRDMPRRGGGSRGPGPERRSARERPPARELNRLEALQRLDAIVLRGRWHAGVRLRQEREALAAEYARDEVMRAARERVRKGVLALIRERGTEAAVDELRRVARLPEAPRLGEADLNSLGYSLLADDDLSTAIEIFRLNVRLHPESANVYDSLAEAYLSAGQLDEAERNYRRALELDSTMDSARRGLREIDERRDGPR